MPGARARKELAGHDFVGFDIGIDLPQAEWLKRAIPGVRYALRVNTTAAQVAACAAGHGIALLPSFVAAAEPRLVALLPRTLGPTRDLWAVSHQDMRKNARVAVLMKWLAERLFEGASLG